MINYAEFKKFFLYNMIGSLIIVALVAVVSVLIGEFSEILARVLGTLGMLVIHSLVSLMFIWDNEKQGTFGRFEFFVNALFFMIIVSFFTSIFGIWEIISGPTVGNMYQFIFILLFAALHGNILHKASNKEDYIDMVILMNYIFMAIVVLMLMPIIFMSDPTVSLAPIFFRLLGAAAIIDGTLSILAIIFHRLHMHKYPKEENPLENTWGQGDEQVSQKQRKGGLSIWVWILLIYLVIQIGFPILGMIFFGRLW